MLAAGTASAAEHSITPRPSSVCKSTAIVGGTETMRRFQVNVSSSDYAETSKCDQKKKNNRE